MCHHTGSASNPYVDICVDQSAVAELTALGDCIGSCKAYKDPLNCKGYKTEDGTTADDPGILSVYPNPNNGMFMIDFAGKSGLLEISVTNMLGQILYTKSVSDFGGAIQQELDLNAAGSGTFFLRIRNEDHMYMQQIVVTH
jgi:hypothetical protein